MRIEKFIDKKKNDIKYIFKLMKKFLQLAQSYINILIQNFNDISHLSYRIEYLL